MILVVLQIVLSKTMFSGQKDREDKMKNALDEIKDFKGREMQKFLNSVQCINGVVMQPCLTLENYEAASNVKHEDILMEETDTDLYPKLSSYSQSYILELGNQLESYFPQKITTKA